MNENKHNLPDDLLSRTLGFYKENNTIDFVEKCDPSGKPLEMIIPYGLSKSGWPCVYRILRQKDKYSAKYIASEVEREPRVEECTIREEDRIILSELFNEVYKIRRKREKNKRPEPITIVT